MLVSLTHYTKAGEIADYIREAIRKDHVDDLKLSLLAKRFLLSESSLTGIFRLRYHTSIRSFIVREKNKYICELLLTQMRIKEIALASGYTELSNFSRDFSKIQGMSPNAWREAKRKVNTGFSMEQCL
ncbi:MAG: AraC family transcriptional regulator [Sediminibacterium sp.]